MYKEGEYVVYKEHHIAIFIEYTEDGKASIAMYIPRSHLTWQGYVPVGDIDHYTGPTIDGGVISRLRDYIKDHDKSIEGFGDYELSLIHDFNFNG